jgi:hypothetical protein
LRRQSRKNRPSITSAAGTTAVGLVSGTLNSANGWYRLDFYGVPTASGCTQVVAGSIPLGFCGEGRDWLGSTFVQISNATASANGSASYTDVQIRRENLTKYFVPGPTWIVAHATREPAFAPRHRAQEKSRGTGRGCFVAGSLRSVRSRGSPRPAGPSGPA